jgi:xylan 1,4-beta-xylosidase
MLTQRMHQFIRILKIKCLPVAGLFFYFSLSAQQLVLRGDHPDPSVVKIGNHYYASSTTSNWMPSFPVFQSDDLINWKMIGHVFNETPSWADYYFWAPEISYENNKVYIYYAAHKKGGNLCVGVASADRPEGPYRDHGPLICQEDGSIDPFAMRDENGKLYLVWKEDANSIGKPTSIWAMPMNEDRTSLTGEKTELFRNTMPWEGNLVEGVSMVRHGGYFYAFYAGAGCCGTGCTYAVGVARSKSLLGPWEKYTRNPVLTGDDQWNCPGHGTSIERNGKYYFLYHAYNRQSNIFTGREGLLIEYKFTADGWIEFIREGQPMPASAPYKYVDTFNENSLPGSWQWSVFGRPETKLKNGKLYLAALPLPGIFLAQETISANYTANAKIDLQRSVAATGIAAIGDENNFVGAIYQNGAIKLVQVKEGKQTVLTTKRISKTSTLSLQMKVQNGKDIQFFYSPGNASFKSLNDKVADAFLPPWDRAVRAGIIAVGIRSVFGVFDSFELTGK